MPEDLSLASLRAAYASRSLTPQQVVTSLWERIQQIDRACFISLTSLEELAARCRELEEMPADLQEALPLWGIPFAVKDNINVKGFRTTAACLSYGMKPATASAPVVQALLDAGGIMLGKTNMDQFAAGLVGTRSPYGTPKNSFDARFIPGGSSSGSGAAVGSGFVTFALGTDTAGSGRVPAMYNGCVGIKPTVGWVSTQGVVPACRSLDCVSCFASSVEDAAAVVRIMEAASRVAEDASCRPPPPTNHSSSHTNNSDRPTVNGHAHGHAFKFGIPGPEFLEFDGPGGPDMAKEYKAAFDEAVTRMQSIGGKLVPVDFAPFCQAAALLYNSAFVAERYAGIREFLEMSQVSKERRNIALDDRLERVTGAILETGTKYSAADVFQAFDLLSDFRCQAAAQMTKVDLLMVPTVLQHYLVKEIEADEKEAQTPTWAKNTLNGRFTNFVNLLDMAAISVPQSVISHPDLTGYKGEAEEVVRRGTILEATGSPRPNLPWGVTLIGPAWSDERLWHTAGQMHTQATK